MSQVETIGPIAKCRLLAPLQVKTASFLDAIEMAVSDPKADISGHCVSLETQDRTMSGDERHNTCSCNRLSAASVGFGDMKRSIVSPYTVESPVVWNASHNTPSGSETQLFSDFA